MTSTTASRSAAERISEILQELGRVRDGELSQEQLQELQVKTVGLRRQDRPGIIFTELARTSGRSLPEIKKLFHMRTSERTLGGSIDGLMPQEGWLADYLTWTRETEAPTAYHFFVAVTVLGTSLGRRVWFDQGAYELFPNIGVILIGPSGRCKKTSAASLGIGLLTQSGGHLVAEMATPEALIDSLKTNASALLYAPELAQFLGKQKYMTGMIPLLTRLFDSPKEWTGKTMGRGETTLTNVTLAAIFCSTLDWMQTAVPEDVFGGGFMSRFLLIVQEDSGGRLFPLPPALSKTMRTDLIKRLVAYRLLKAQAQLDEAARGWFINWYKRHSHTRPEGNDHFGGYYSRKPDRLLQLSVILNVSRHDPKRETILLTEEDVQQALTLLDWLEGWLPGTFDRVSGSAVGEDQSRIIRQLRLNYGTMDHSSLLRRNSSRLNAEQFRRAMATLVEAKLADYSKTTRQYYLTPLGWGL